eukprot:gene13406-15840_t
MTGSWFENNSADVITGVVHYRSTDLYVHNTNVVLRDSGFVGNSAGSQGGVLGFYGVGGTSVQGCLLRGNHVAGYGGAIHFGGSSDESAEDTYCAYNTQEFSEAFANITRTLFTNNHANSSGGAVYQSTGGDLSMTGIVMEGNSAETGGGIYVGLLATTLVISQSNLSSNKASMDGGAIYQDVGVVWISSVVFEQNQAGSRGGGVYAKNLTMLGSQLNANEAIHGGGIFAGAEDFSGGASLHGVTVERNLAKSLGGGVYCYNCALLGVHNVSVLSNEAGAGGGMYIIDTFSIDITDVTAVSNQALAKKGARGGFMVVEAVKVHSQLRLMASLIRKNLIDVDTNTAQSFMTTEFTDEKEHLGHFQSLEDCGGAAVLSSIAREQEDRNGSLSVTVLGTLLEENRAPVAGALCVAGRTLVTMHDASIMRNMAAATLLGGLKENARVLNDTSAYTSDATNVAAMGGRGGGVMVMDQAELVMESSVMSANFGLYGAALAVNNDAGSITIADVTLVNNSCMRNGGAFFMGVNSTENITLSRLAFTDNYSPNGDAVFMTEIPACVNCTYAPLSVAPNSNQSLTCRELDEEDWIGGMPVALSVSTSEIANVTHFEVESNSKLGIVVLLHDQYEHHVCAWDTALTLQAVRQNEHQAVPDLVGARNAIYTAGRANFTEVKIIGGVGEAYTLQVSTGRIVRGKIGPYFLVHVISVQLAPCKRGEVHKTDTNVCEPCAETHIKLDNSTALCQSCEDVKGIRCLGGAKLAVEAGYWLSPSADQCADLACLTRLVYECDAEKACTTDEGLRVVDLAAEQYVSPEMCASGHREDVVLCGGCESSYYMAASQVCQQCPADHWVIVQ